jgi:hypothetical protein
MVGMLPNTIGFVYKTISHISNVFGSKHDFNNLISDDVFRREQEVNSLIHRYISNDRFPEDMYWIQCMLSKRNPSLEKNRVLDKMGWLIEDFKLFICNRNRIGGFNKNALSLQERNAYVCMYPDFEKNILFHTLDEYKRYIQIILAETPISDIISFHPDQFDHHLCFHDWNRTTT